MIANLPDDIPFPTDEDYAPSVYEEYATPLSRRIEPQSVSTIDRSRFNGMTRDEVLDFLLPLYNQTVLRLEKIEAISTNRNMQPTHRLAAIHLLNEHPQEVLTGQPFKVKVTDMYKKLGISDKTATSTLAAMKESGAVKYDCERSITDKGYQVTESTISFSPNFEKMNTKDTKPVTEARERETKKREERKLQIIACQHCGHVEEVDSAEVMIVPLCSKCDKPSVQNAQIIPLREILLVKEEQELEAIPQAVTPVIEVEVPVTMPELTPYEQSVRGKMQICLDRHVSFALVNGKVALSGNGVQSIPKPKLDELLSYIGRHEPTIIKLIQRGA